MSLYLYETDQWRVKKFGICNSMMVVGYDRKTRCDCSMCIPHYLYNKLAEGKLRVDYSYEFKKDSYEKEHLKFVEVKTGKIVRKLPIYTK